MRAYWKPVSYLLRRNKYILFGCLLGLIFSSGLMPPLLVRNDCRGSIRTDHSAETATVLELTGAAEYEALLGLERWYRQVSTEQFTPVLRNQSSHEPLGLDGPSAIRQSMDPPSSNMVRDKKLKFYRPRFHSIELNVKLKLLICVLLRDQFLADQLLGQYINWTAGSMLVDWAEHLLYFRPDAGSTTFRVMAPGHGRASDLWPLRESQPYHVQMLDYVIQRRQMNEYALVLLMTEQTMVHAHNLGQYLDRFTVADLVFSAATEQSILDSSILHHGLVLSSSLIEKCQTQWSCYAQSQRLRHRSARLEPPPLSLGQATEMVRREQDSIMQAIFLFPMPPFGSESFGLLQALLSVDTMARLKCQLADLESLIRAIEHQNQTLFQEPAGSLSSHKPRNRYEVTRWSYWNETHSLMPDELHVIRPLVDHQLQEVASLRDACLGHVLPSGHRLHRARIQNLYRKFDAVRGLEYVIDLSLAPSAQPIRFRLLKPLNPVELVADSPNRNAESVRLSMVLPVRGQYEVPLAVGFLHRYGQLCRSKPDHQTILIVVLIRTRAIESARQRRETEEFERLKKVSLHLQSQVDPSKIVFLDVNPPPDTSSDATEPEPRTRFPSELVYLDLISRSLPEQNLLLLHCRASMVFSVDLLNRVRTNTIPGHQVFVAIPFVEYRLRSTISNDQFRQLLQQQLPDSSAPGTRFEVRKDHGYFDQTNNEFVAFYLADYVRARKRSASLMPVVRNRESILKYQNLYYDAELDLYRMFARYNRAAIQPPLVLMRAVEPELRLLFTSITADCDHFESNRFAAESCLGRRWRGMGPKQKLAAIVLQYVATNSTTL